MTLEEFEKEVFRRGFQLIDASKKVRRYGNGNPYPLISVFIEKKGISVRKSTSFQSHQQCWLEDIRKDGDKVYMPSSNEKEKICGHRCREPMIHQCEWCLEYKEG